MALQKVLYFVGQWNIHQEKDFCMRGESCWLLGVNIHSFIRKAVVERTALVNLSNSPSPLESCQECHVLFFCQFFQALCGLSWLISQLIHCRKMIKCIPQQRQHQAITRAAVFPQRKILFRVMLTLCPGWSEDAPREYKTMRRCYDNILLSFPGESQETFIWIVFVIFTIC